MKSIYERIDAVVRLNGMVPADFVLEDADKPSDRSTNYKGELEGVIGQSVPKKYDEEAVEKALTFIKSKVIMNAKLAVHDFDDNELGFCVATIRGPLLREIVKNIYDYDPHKLCNLAYSLVTFGLKKETVKLGLALLVLFDFGDDEIVKKHLITIGLYEEFTSYVIALTKSWPAESKEHVYYIYAQKLSGFGKINAVECLEPVNEEVKEWLLCNGCRNDVSYGYLGLIVAEKCNFKSRLEKGNLTEEEMQGARDIMTGLLDEGPRAGISELKDADKVAMGYLRELAKHEITLADIANMFDIRNYFEEQDTKASSEMKNKIFEQISRMLGNISVSDKIRENLGENPRIAIRTAEETKTDVSNELIELTRIDFNRYYVFCDYLFSQNRMVDDFLAIAAEKIKYGDFPTGMGNESYPAENKTVFKLDFVTQFLSAYVGKGSEILNACIDSPIVRWRSAAAMVLKNWETSENANIKKINQDLFHAVKKIKKKEINDKLKTDWDEILNFK